MAYCTDLGLAPPLVASFDIWVSTRAFVFAVTDRDIP
jgi:hypothetical protein